MDVISNLSPKTQAWLKQRHGLFIGGVWVDAKSGAEHTTRDPATNISLATVAMGTRDDIDAAVIAARKAFAGPWVRLTHFERARLLSRLARLVEDNTDMLTEIEVMDSGMPATIARLTIENIAEMFDYYAGAAQAIEGTTTTPPRHITDNFEALTYTVREAIGVAGLIVPWNVPISTAVLKLAPALAAGCTVIIKPSELTPLSILRLAELSVEAGFPPGVINVVNGTGKDAGARLAEHPDVDKISFTGSTATGRKIVSAALGNMKKVALELGGKSPVIVMPDADLDLATVGVAMATFFLQGQNCMAGTRIYIHESIHDELVGRLKLFCENMVLGHGIDPLTHQGPLVSSSHCDRVMAFIQSGIDEGARLVCGGTRVPKLAGNFVSPTIFTECTSNMKIVREEIFGPVMAIQKFTTTDLDEIATLANDSRYGLSGSVWTQNLSTAHALVARIRSGHVSVNCHGAVGTNIPFGGYRESGWGREFGQVGLDAYLETKAVTVQL